ncbi:hypothetical protein, partial [Pseudoalteromonas sp.]|uniref:hypothetical protein n=1 Tax=Pseudoalteromonas sp. TaxID=53249 RepID=UPI0026354AE8
AVVTVSFGSLQTIDIVQNGTSKKQLSQIMHMQMVDKILVTSLLHICNLARCNEHHPSLQSPFHKRLTFYKERRKNYF